MEHEELIRSCHLVDGEQNVYCIAPQKGRISFNSQQVRALNLVWAIAVEKANERSELEGREINVAEVFKKQNVKISVIGGGVAGVTIASAFYALGADVDLFDSNTKVMSTQLHTKHRMVHPSINWWPVDPKFNPTTNMAFLNWTANDCDVAIKKMAEQWEMINKPGSRAHFHKSTTIDTFTSTNLIPQEVHLTCDKDTEYRGYSVVVLACGFGEERPYENFKTKRYWTPDSLEAWRGEALVQGKVGIVSGCGDGGLLDALRLAYEFDHGALSYRIAYLAKDTIVEKELSKTNLKSTHFEDLVQKIGRDKKCEEISNLLKSKLTEKLGFVILLDALNSSPYQTEAAPIHKFLIAYAIASKTIVFHKSKLVKSDSPKGYVQYTDSEGETVKYRKSDTRILIRHGAEANFSGLLSDEQIEKLKQSDSTLAKFSHQKAWGEDFNFPVPNEMLCKKRDKSKFIGYWEHELEATLRLVGAKEARVTGRQDHFELTNIPKKFRHPKLLGVDAKFPKDVPTANTR